MTKVISKIIILSATLLTPLAGGETAKANLDIELITWQGEKSTFSDIENTLTRRIQVDPYSAKDHYLLAHLYIRKYSESPSEMNLLKKASDLAQQSIDLSPAKEYGYVALAEVLDVMGQTNSALQILRNNSSPFKKGWRTSFIIARLQLDRLGNDEVLAALKGALNKKGASHEIISPYALAIMKSQYQNSQLLKILRQWNQEHPSETFNLAIGNTLVNQGKYKQAHRIYKKIYTPDYKHQEAMLNDAIILAKHLKKRQKAKTLLRKILKSAAKSSPTNNVRMAAASRQLGEIYLAERKHRFARKHFVNAVIASPNRFRSLETITESYREQKSYRNLVSTIKALNEEMPGSGILHALLGETLSEDLKDHESALNAFTDAIILEPNRSDFYNGMGLAYYRSNKLNKALSMFNFASQIDPEDAVAKYNSACVMARQNKKSEAITSLREAINLDPRLIQNAKQDKDFRSIRQTQGFNELIEPHPNYQKHTVSEDGGLMPLHEDEQKMPTLSH